MWLAIIALILGFSAIYFPRNLPVSAELNQYIGVAVVAGLDSIIGAVRSVVEGRFNDRIFVSGFFINAGLAALLLYILGTWMEIPHISTAIIVALIVRMFNNFGFLRRYVVARLFEKRISADNSFPEP